MLGYVFAYGSLVAEHVLGPPEGSTARAAPVWGELVGWARRWNVAMENLAPESDDKFFAEEETGRRPDVFGVWLNVDRAPGVRCNGLALPVDEEALRALDRRERNYARIEVTDDFRPGLGHPVWTFTGRAAARERFRRGHAAGRAFVSGRYRERVEAGFAAGGEEVLRAYRASTETPRCPVRDDLRLVRAPGGV